MFAGVATLLLSQPSLHKVAGLSSLHLPHQVRQAYHGRQPQHNIYKLVPADVQTALLKAYEEAAAEDE